MAKKDKPSNNVSITFRGGPRDGSSFMVSKDQVPDRIRLALPVWANYYRIGQTYEYEWKDIPWEPIPVRW